jgi:uncharacterized protein (TIGR02594 family)
MPIKYRVKRSTDLLDKPNGTPIDDLTINQEVFGTDKTDGDFIQLDIGDPPGWVHKDDVERADAGARPPIDRCVFVVECVTDELEFNANRELIAPWFVSADFLIARAIIETNVTNAGPKQAGSNAVGPLQVSPAEWKAFLDNGKELAADSDPNGFDRPLLQVRGAAWRMHADAMKMNDLRIAAGKASKDDPFIPSYLDVFFAYLTNSPAAALAILDAQASGQTIGIDQVLRQPTGPFTKEQVDALLTARSAFFGTPNNPRLLKDSANPQKDVVTNAETALNAALTRAFNDVKQCMPEAVPVVSAGGGGAPWFAVAKAAETAGVAEANGNDRDTILDYFNATDHGRPNSVATPWCGAFAAHCMKGSGNPTAAASIPKGAAAAASWKGWGSRLPFPSDNIPQGALIVLSPTPNSGRSGHVAFFDRFSPDKKKVFLLGGNQSNKVCTIDFPSDRVAYVGWLDLAPASAAVGEFKLPADIAAENRQFAKLIVDKFAAAGYGRIQQIAALANAIAESRLNPNAHNTKGEDSVGLFQLFRIKGVGGKHSVEALKDPGFNTDLIIAEAKRFSIFAKADSLDKAVDAFVRFVERPANTEAQIAKRLQIAQSLIA